LATEWEILVLNLLSKVGNLKHERTFQNGKRPDIYFRSKRIQPFIADITAVSDRDLDKKNPSDFFYECVREYFRKSSLLIGGLTIEFSGERIGEYRDQRVKLHLPPKREIPVFVQKHFAAIVQAIKSDPHRSFVTRIVEDNVDIGFSYGPGSIDVIVAGPPHRAPYSRQDNPVFNALKAKARQLKQCGFRGPAGVFLCDADCYALRDRPRGAG
jgi:hypothetical protein